MWTYKGDNLLGQYKMWTYNDKQFTTHQIGDWFGFVYCITNKLTGKRYIGKKQFWAIRRKRIKGQKRRQITTTESDWPTYYGSSKSLKADIKLLGEKHFKREILKLCSTAKQLSYCETKLQFDLDVLYAVDGNGDKAYYNRTIMNRYFY